MRNQKTINETMHDLLRSAGLGDAAIKEYDKAVLKYLSKPTKGAKSEPVASKRVRAVKKSSAKQTKQR